VKNAAQPKLLSTRHEREIVPLRDPSARASVPQRQQRVPDKSGIGSISWRAKIRVLRHISSIADERQISLLSLARS
jgi:hypothetical protein